MTAILFAPYEHADDARLRRLDRQDALGVALGLAGGALLLHGLWVRLRWGR